MCKKLDDSSFNYSCSMFMWITWRDHALFMDSLSSLSGDLLWSIAIPNLKCLRVSATKMKGNAKICKSSRFEPPFGWLRGGVTQRVHLLLDGKRIVDLLLAIGLIELFSLALTAEVLLSEICQNRRFLKGWATLSTNLGRCGRRLQTGYKPLDRGMM